MWGGGGSDGGRGSQSEGYRPMGKREQSREREYSH